MVDHSAFAYWPTSIISTSLKNSSLLMLYLILVVEDLVDQIPFPNQSTIKLIVLWWSLNDVNIAWGGFYETRAAEDMPRSKQLVSANCLAPIVGQRCPCKFSTYIYLYRMSHRYITRLVFISNISGSTGCWQWYHIL